MQETIKKIAGVIKLNEVEGNKKRDLVATKIMI